MSKRKGILLTLFVMLLWGSLFPAVKLGYKAYDVVSTGDIFLFAGLRFTIAGGTICLYASLRDKSSYSRLKGSFAPILLSGFFGVILHYGFTYTGLTLTDSSKTAIIKQIGALLYVCFSFLFFKEDKPTVVKLLGAVIGFLGIVVINLGEAGGFDLGDALILCASLCTVFSSVAGKKAMKKIAPVTMTGVSQLFGGIVLLLLGFALGGSVRFSWQKWYIFGYICLASIVSYCVWFSIVQTETLSKLFIVKFAEPMFACAFGWLLLGENIWKWQYLVAFLLISVGILLSYLPNGIRKREKKK